MYVLTIAPSILKGYVLSNEALNRFVNVALKGKSTKGLCNFKKDSGNEDVEMGLCLESANVTAVDTRDKLGRQKFLSDTPQSWLFSDRWSAKAKSYSYYPLKQVMS